jgi:hypothetical protein
MELKRKNHIPLILLKLSRSDNKVFKIQINKNYTIQRFFTNLTANYLLYNSL